MKYVDVANTVLLIVILAVLVIISVDVTYMAYMLYRFTEAIQQFASQLKQ